MSLTLIYIWILLANPIESIFALPTHIQSLKTEICYYVLLNKIYPESNFHSQFSCIQAINNSVWRSCSEWVTLVKDWQNRWDIHDEEWSGRLSVATHIEELYGITLWNSEPLTFAPYAVQQTWRALNDCWL